MNKALLDTYSSLKSELTNIQNKIESQLAEQITQAQIKVHSLNGRVKGEQSLEKKLARPDRDYKELSQVTDLLAFRIITYSEDLIPQVARVIENTFAVDFAHSVNKLESEEADKFGYRSLHYVCALPSPGLEGFKFEIQIRTILQHTWAEIEHDIGYKASEQLPREFRRRFSQIASLLEVADREFASIRLDLSEYSQSVKSQAIQDNLELDSLTLASLVEKTEIRALDAQVAQFLDRKQSSEPFFTDYILKVLRAAGLKSVGEVLSKAALYEGQLKTFLPQYFEFSKAHLGFTAQSVTQVNSGYSLLFLAHMHLLCRDDLLINKVESLSRFYQEVDEIKDVGRAREISLGLVELAR